MLTVGTFMGFFHHSLREGTAVKSEEEVGPLTRALKAEEEAGDLRVQLDASEAARIKDNEALLSRIGELRGELSRLKGIEELAFDYGSHLKFLVTALCPIIKGTMIEEGDTEWEVMAKTWLEARERLGLNQDGLRIAK
jgi:hypothetical protein